MGDRSGLTAGDAVVVVALLLFISGWVGGFLWDLSGVPDSKLDNAWADLMLLAIIVLPAVWAGGLVRHVVERAHRD